MTPDELARIPEGGAKWEHSEDFDRWFMIIQNDKIIGYGTNEESTRLIVGSINVALLIKELQTRAGWIDFDQTQATKDRDFWINYMRE
jgi:hypothetical protein